MRLMLVFGLIVFAACGAAQGKEQGTSAASIGAAEALLAGSYENSAQVAAGRAVEPPPQHVVITVEPTPLAGWEIWHVHMDVDPKIADSAGSDTSLDAFWAMHFSKTADGKSLELIPYTLGPSIDESAVKASAFDESQWLPLEACALVGEFGAVRVLAQVPPDEMCVAETMGLGGKRAFLPNSIERQGEWLHAQLMYFGRPWQVDARRVAGR